LFGQFELITNGDTKRTIAVSGTATIGRAADNDIVLEDWAVSRCHALLLTRVGGSSSRYIRLNDAHCSAPRRDEAGSQ
jgi:hypothetical protein